ncbi:hypothetical protein RCC89_09440 [Cytophagaceae bacterium ABcell3]|nr:hypothetical protein RCC89_09440 [Cytophagaceae bacterium ABcell3]
MAGESKKTTNHNQIKRWVEARDGKPASVKGTGDNKNAGLLRFRFENGRQPKAELKDITWDEFFDQFEKNKLQMVYQDKTKTGRKSRFNKLVNREPVKRAGTSSGKSKRSNK